MSKNYPEANFYGISESMYFTIRGEVDIIEEVDPDCLQKAVDTAFARFPYFSVRVVIKNNTYNLDPNPLPHNIINSRDRITLGTEEVNYHLVVISYYENRIFFNVSHSITDGTGRAPLTKAVLYYYFRYRFPDNPLDPEGIYLADSPAFPDERTLPLSWEDVKDARPTYYKRIGRAFSLSERDLIRDHQQTEYRFKISEQEFMKLNRSSDASPSVLVSALLARMTWTLHDDIDENIVINLCMNMRPGLGNRHSHLPLFTCIPLHCTPSMKDYPLDLLCTCMRGMVILQSQEDNVKYLYQQMILGMEELDKIPSMEERRRIISQGFYQENGLLSSTFITSYVGKSNLGCLAPYVYAIFTTVDAIPKGGVIVEVTSADGFFYFTFMQDFSTDVYVKEFIRSLREKGLVVSEMGYGPIMTPEIELPAK